ncbi:hypothetical protein QWI17_15920 [Gilvimarinus sp. SDUM040013]|uniref:Uncharacterized protein n=1 Tax=Gilvimarinus gilvus TaxID=3058038 RepID=A0ABU4RZH4_9GAMM|nr:hypothetical protein [Gilvimarinus sp. SDUM040013]MDO3387329.1 hypothetical protein [Gilvimarinus sp. SDUM040013]MDX6849018.1 hypothetical protein [Gilvimarinus sp. SDUM040013]
MQVVAYFHRQDRVAVSYYSSKLKSGERVPQVVPLLKDDLCPYYYDYERIYANWSQIFGGKTVQTGIFESLHLAGGDLLTDFCSRVGIKEDEKIRPPKINRSLSQKEVQLLLELNRQWPKKACTGLTPRENHLWRASPASTRGATFLPYAQSPRPFMLILPPVMSDLPEPYIQS